MTKKSATHSKNALRAWIQLIKTAKRIEGRMNSHFVTEHQSSMTRFDVLANLVRCEDHTTTTSRLSSMLLASKGNITRLLDRMVSDGLIQREIDPDDKRVSVVKMLPAGESLFNALATDHESWIDDLFVTFSNSELKDLSSMLETLRERLDETQTQ
jgi:DNA-binding MarR family transcriptional regulator